MDDKPRHVEEICPSCGASDSEPDATFCQTCGSKLDSALVRPPAPPPACEAGKTIAGRFTVQSLLWTAPTYNAYDAVGPGSQSTHHTIIEQRLSPNDPFADVLPMTPTGGLQGKVSGSLEDAAPAFERFGLFKPIEHSIE